MAARTFDDLVGRIRSEYVEMPGLWLTDQSKPSGCGDSSGSSVKNCCGRSSLTDFWSFVPTASTAAPVRATSA